MLYIKSRVISSSNDPAYISTHKNARNIIQQVERDEIIEELVKSYLEKE